MAAAVAESGPLTSASVASAAPAVAAAAATAGLPPASATTGDGGWPEPRELESWLLGTASEADPAATAVRKLLQTNPGVQAHLASDEVMAGIVQLFAKRVRAKIQLSEPPLQTSTLIRPLCELTWRIVAVIIMSLSDFGVERGVEGISSSEAVGAIGAGFLPTNFWAAALPTKAHGGLKMLLKTNEELGFRFNEARRAYLRELAEHRDRQRRLSADAHQRLELLREQPIMFYEPLESLLDETTKDFVREVVEERMKLGLQADFQHLAAEEEQEKSTGLLQEKIDELESTVEQLEQDARQLASRAQRADQMLKRAEDSLQQSRAETEDAARRAEAAEERSEKEDVHDEPSEPNPPQDDGTDKALIVANQRLKEVSAEIELRRSEIEDLQGTVEELDGERAEATRKLLAEAANSALLQAQVESLQVELAALQQKLTSDSADGAPKLQKSDVEAAQSVAASATAAIASANAAAAEANGRAQALEQQVEQHRQAEQELRTAKTELEESRSAAESRAAAAEQQAKKLAAALQSSTSADARETVSVDDRSGEVAQFGAELTQLQDALAEKDGEISRLRSQLKKAQEKASFSSAEEAKPPQEEEVADTEAKQPSSKWKTKYEELEEQHEALEEETEKLRAKVKALLRKLKDSMAEEEMKEMLERIELDMPVIFRKSKAWERLWDDANRRISLCNVRAQRLSLVQQEMVEDATEAAEKQGGRAMEQVNLLANLQRASITSQTRFHQAAQVFHAMFRRSSFTEAVPVTTVTLEILSPPESGSGSPQADTAQDSPKPARLRRPSVATGCPPALKADSAASSKAAPFKAGGAKLRSSMTMPAFSPSDLPEPTPAPSSSVPVPASPSKGKAISIAGLLREASVQLAEESQTLAVSSEDQKLGRPEAATTALAYAAEASRPELPRMHTMTESLGYGGQDVEDAELQLADALPAETPFLQSPSAAEMSGILLLQVLWLVWNRIAKTRAVQLLKVNLGLAVVAGVTGQVAAPATAARVGVSDSRAAAEKRAAASTVVAHPVADIPRNPSFCGSTEVAKYVLEDVFLTTCFLTVLKVYSVGFEDLSELRQANEEWTAELGHLASNQALRREGGLAEDVYVLE
ncbi:unnamed protein product [Polarella glacialis]|uniref:Uncharacterized protein n=1 Tax=Polarella glacialis TaxID=89957 RepID=A0A813D5M8_POLGL|nr:unnamed protein product [Polarella glacialis]